MLLVFDMKLYKTTTEEVKSEDLDEGIQEFFCCGGCWSEDGI